MVGVKELKDRLSQYLREVKAGAVVLVSERTRVIAEMRRPTMAEEPSRATSLLHDWAQEGSISLPRAAKRKCQKSPVHLPAGTARRILALERAET